MKSPGTKKISSNGGRKRMSVSKRATSSKNKNKKVFPSFMIKELQKRADSVARHPLAQSAIKWVKTPGKVLECGRIPRGLVA